MRLSIVFIGLGLALGAALIAGQVQAQPDDHLRCYRVKGDLKLKGFVDVETPQFGLEPGCKIAKAKFFCGPAQKSNVDVVNPKTNQAITPLPFSAPPAPGDRICWKVKCPEQFPSNQIVTDQFGTQTLRATRFTTSLLCTPAVKGTEFCGDGLITGGEACEPADDRACPGRCQADCSCEASFSTCGRRVTCFSDLEVDQCFDRTIQTPGSVVGAAVCAAGFPLRVQTFTVGFSGTLEMLQLKVYQSCGPPTLPDTTFTIDLVGVDGNGIPDLDSILATGTFHTDDMPPLLGVVNDGFVRVDLPAPGVQVLAGQSYGIVARQPPGGCYLWVLDQSGGYPGGRGLSTPLDSGPPPPFGEFEEVGDFGFRTLVLPF